MCVSGTMGLVNDGEAHLEFSGEVVGQHGPTKGKREATINHDHLIEVAPARSRVLGVFG